MVGEPACSRLKIKDLTPIFSLFVVVIFSCKLTARDVEESLKEACQLT
jgi:hypothetical protein